MKSACKGIFWRGTTSTYVSQHGSIELRKSLRKLKRVSCPGCEECEWVEDEIREAIAEGDLCIDHIKSGVYTYKIHCSRGYYDQYEEIEYIEFIEIKEMLYA